MGLYQDSSRATGSGQQYQDGLPCLRRAAWQSLSIKNTVNGRDPSEMGLYGVQALHSLYLKIARFKR